MKVHAGVALYLARHPRELARLPRWLPERSASPIELRRPWWPYDATAWVGENLPAGARVFEYGGGGSSVWLQDLSAEVTVVEDHPEWAQRLAGAGLTVIHHRRGDGYAQVIASEPEASFDLVIVDGKDRLECVRQAMPKVRPGGLLLLDDTAWPNLAPAAQILAGWERRVFGGFKPGDVWPGETTVWRRPR